MGGANNVTIGPVPDAQNDGVQIAPINISATGTVVAPVAGKRISVHGMHVTANLAGTLQVQDVSATATVNLTGPMTLAAGVPLDLEFENYPHYTCAPGDALVFVLATITQLSGRIKYMQG